MNFFKRKTISADDLATEELMRHYAKKDKRAARVSKGDMSQAQNALASLTSEFRHNAESKSLIKLLLICVVKEIALKQNLKQRRQVYRNIKTRTKQAVKFC